MSLESELKKNTAALEALTIAIAMSGQPTVAPAHPSVAPAASAQAPPVAQAPVASAQAAPQTPPAGQAPPITGPMTVAELNDAIVVEFKRLGQGKEPIMAVMAAFGVSSVDQLTADQFAPLLVKIRELA